MVEVRRSINKRREQRDTEAQKHAEKCRGGAQKADGSSEQGEKWERWQRKSGRRTEEQSKAGALGSNRKMELMVRDDLSTYGFTGAASNVERSFLRCG